ncbi:MAG: hypothetical protein ABJG47_04300 [Ekhidna sp.]
MLRITLSILISGIFISLPCAQEISSTDFKYDDLKSQKADGFKFEIEYDPKGSDKEIGIINIEGIPNDEISRISLIIGDKQIAPSEYIQGNKSRLPFVITKDHLVLDGDAKTQCKITYIEAGDTTENSLEILAIKNEVDDPPVVGSGVITLITDYVDKANDYIDEFNIKYDKKRNIYRKGNQVYIFIDENGRLIKSGLPTTALQEYVYNFIVISCVSCEHPANLKLEVEGDYSPSYLKFAPNEGAKNHSDLGDEDEVEYEAIDFGSYGPFTGTFEVKLTKIEDGTNKVLFSNTVKVADLYHVSISTGLFKTSLRNPQNIEKVAISGTAITTDSTLIADDPNMRGVLTVMATFYPAGRSFLFTPNEYNGADRLGIVVGAQLDDQLKENFFLGASYDFARGGSFAAGIHCGRRNYIAEGDYDDFEYGKDPFIGDLKVRKEWDIGLFFGVIIDTRIAGQLFKSGSD